MTPTFHATREEFATIVKICERADSIAKALGSEPPHRMTLVMDIEATHSNGCPLKLDDLLAFPDADFVHDVWGIMRHMDRDTGQLTGCFLPRCAAIQH